VGAGCWSRVSACCWLTSGSRGLPLITRIRSISFRRPSLRQHTVKITITTPQDSDPSPLHERCLYSRGVSSTSGGSIVPVCDAAGLDVFDEEPSLGSLEAESGHAEAQAPCRWSGQTHHLHRLVLGHKYSQITWS